MGRTLIGFTFKKEHAGQKWGFGITGGKDVGLTFRIEKVQLISPAGAAGLKNLDYLVTVNGREIFSMGHNELVKLIKDAGDTIELEVERGEGDCVVPSFDMMFPKEAADNGKVKRQYYADAMLHGYEAAESPAMFTSCGKPRLKTGKYNTSMTLYSDDTLYEMASSGGHGFVDPDKLAPDACPAAKNRKRFDPAKSAALDVILAHEQADFAPQPARNTPIPPIMLRDVEAHDNAAVITGSSAGGPPDPVKHYRGT